MMNILHYSDNSVMYSLREVKIVLRISHPIIIIL